MMDTIINIMHIASPFIAIGGYLLIQKYILKEQRADREIGDIKNKIEGIRKDIIYATTAITFIADKLEVSKKIETIAKTVYRTSSPIVLTEEGENIADRSGLTKHIQEHFNEYSKELDKYSLEVQIDEQCGVIARRFFDSQSEEALEMRNELYKEGIYDAKEMYAIKLRQMYLELKRKQKAG